MKFETNYSLNKGARAMNYHCSAESMTVPDQALSLRDLLNKYTHGIAPAVNQTGVYESDGDDFDDMDPLRVPGTDIVDIHEMSEYVSGRINEAIKDSKNKAEKERLEAMKRDIEASVRKSQESAGKPAE